MPPRAYLRAVGSGRTAPPALPARRRSAGTCCPPHERQRRRSGRLIENAAPPCAYLPESDKRADLSLFRRRCVRAGRRRREIFSPPLESHYGRAAPPDDEIISSRAWERCECIYN